MTSIPVLDLDAPEILRDFARAYGDIGFAYIENHGIAPDRVASVFAAARGFHALPMAEKMALAVDRTHRGYIPIGTSTDRLSELAQVTRPNQSASFMLMREDPAPNPEVYLSGPNRWPDLPEFRADVSAYMAEMSALGHRVMKIALQAAGIDDFSCLSAFDTPTIWLRLLHYPPQPAQRPDDLYGSAPHTDFGALTFLAQDDVGGLEVCAPDGTWIAAPHRPGSFVVNVGDMLHRMTNGRLRSTPHRVINRSGRERYSCPFFYDPHVHSVIAPLPGTGAPRFDPIRFDAFLRHQLESSYDAHRPDDAAPFLP